MDDPNNRRRRRGQATEQTGAEFDAAPNNFDSSFGTQPGDGLQPDRTACTGAKGAPRIRSREISAKHACGKKPLTAFGASGAITSMP